MTLKAKILLVEDDPNLSAVLSDYLEMLEYSTTQAADGEEGLSKFSQDNFDLCILDVMLPKKDGFSLAKDIREINEQIPVVFLTARGQNDDRIAGFRVGCDDYITKPFSSEELALRIEAILKRCMNRNMRSQSSILDIGSYRFDSVNLVLRFNNEEQKLTPKEAALLKLLCSYRNNLLPRDTALKEIWGDSDYFIGRSMDVFIARLRKYLRHDPSVVIQNVHGSGFKLEVRE
ncbi:MAG: response regulator transcription factor [Bacteroidales bacterium]|nr:response regulator transcription factor [Bacteroidales bacterium]MBK9358793.1 response regulator transcription factor [Bacteroidales bacterium]